MIHIQNERKLTKIAALIRQDILTISFKAQSAHTGGALSCVEILTSLYFHVLKINSKNPNWENRDRLIFSKAHDAKALYAVLCRRGFFPKKILSGYEIDGGLLPGHSTRNCVPGVEVSTGSLGHGLSLACGIALAGKLTNKNYRVFALLSDGECDCGSTWEAILFASHHKLDNLIAIIDCNKLQGFGYTKDILNLEPFIKKWQSFNWAAIKINGHNFKQLISALNKIPFQKNKPSVILAQTIKGQGGVAKHINRISSQYIPPATDEYKKTLTKLRKIK